VHVLLASTLQTLLAVRCFAYVRCNTSVCCCCQIHVLHGACGRRMLWMVLLPGFEGLFDQLQQVLLPLS
jgi:hypothetical protein